MTSSLRAGISALFGTVALAAGCGEADPAVAEGEGGSSGSGHGGTAGGGGSAAAGAIGGTGGVAGKPCSGPADCGASEFCSATGQCLPQGSCGSDADCAATPGSECSAGGHCIPQGSCETDQDCDAGFTCQPADGGMQCVPGGGCGAEEYGAEAVPPNMLLVVDRSCSMRALVGGKSKWQITVEAIVKLTTDYQDQIRFGVTLFPDLVGNNCLQESPTPVPCAAGTESQVQTLFQNSLNQSDPNYPDGPCVTNIDTAMMQASNEPSLKDPSRQNFAVLITDGKQAGCSAAGGDPGTESILAGMFAAGIPTFVVGFGSAIDPAQMNEFADQGGVPRSDPTTRYYQADDAATLGQAFDAIAGAVIGCTLALGQTPPDPAELYAFFDNVGVPRDPTHQSGWDYDPATNSVTFYGADCDKLKSGQVSDVDIVFGCNQPTPN
jgi:hypothetical protein